MKWKRKREIRCGIAFLLSSFIVAEGFAANNCGDIANAYGPFDYRDGVGMEIVVAHHFTPEVETLISGKSGYLGGDIDYTLRAFPTYPRALQAMVLLGQKEKTDRPQGANYTVECYFDRALRFRQDDPMVYLVYSNFLFKQGKIDQALSELQKAEKLSPDNTNIQYNLGLLYFEKQDYDSAVKYARKAYRQKVPKGLKEKLARAGKWTDADEKAQDETKPDDKPAKGAEKPKDDKLAKDAEKPREDAAVKEH